MSPAYGLAFDRYVQMPIPIRTVVLFCPDAQIDLTTLFENQPDFFEDSDASNTPPKFNIDTKHYGF